MEMFICNENFNVRISYYAIAVRHMPHSFSGYGISDKCIFKPKGAGLLESHLIPCSAMQTFHQTMLQNLPPSLSFKQYFKISNNVVKCISLSQA